MNASGVQTVAPCFHKFHSRCIVEYIQDSNLCTTSRTQCELQGPKSPRNNLQSEKAVAEQLSNTNDQQFRPTEGRREAAIVVSVEVTRS